MNKWKALRSIGLATLVAASAVSLCATAALAEWPEKPVRWVVGFAPGGGADATARVIAKKLSEKWGQPVIIDNKPGAAATIAADIVAKADPNGYTINFATLNHTVTPFQRKLTFDPIKSFEPVIYIGQHPGVLVVHPSVPANTVGEFLDWVKASPGKYNFGSSGSDAPFLMMEILKKATGIDIRNITYSGGGPTVVALLGGEVQAAFSGVDSTKDLIASGKLKALAVTTTTRVPELPDLPTLAEAANLPGFNEGTWYGVLAPAGTPADIVNKLNKDINEVLHDPEIRDRMLSNGFIFKDNTPAEFRAFLQQDLDKWSALLKSITF